MLAITFHGAAQTTTGSMHLVEANGLRILLDCGLYQGHRKESFERNRALPFDPARLDVVVLSHAHIDHSGNLPTLVKHGFKGRVLCTPPTAELCDILLRDSAFLQAQDVNFVNKKRHARGQRPFELLYDIPDVERLMQQIQPEPLHREVALGRDVYVTLHEAGHILGSAIVQLDIRRPHAPLQRVVFTGDLGQRDQPIIRDPARVEGATALLIESTYADRDHPSAEDVAGRLKGFIEDIHQQKSRLIIPAFSVGRTQHLLYVLNKLVEQGRVPPTPVYVDSPLASKATAIYARHSECYDEDAAALTRKGDNPLMFRGLQFTHSVQESMALNNKPGPLIIVSASGMCEGGRIVHHLRNGIADPRNIVLIVGFQAEHTLGRRIVERQPVLNIFGEEVPLNARVHTINALSAHADRRGLMAWFDAANSKALKHTFAVHGDKEQVGAMKSLLESHGAQGVLAPVPGQRVVLSENK
ncbi:MAG: MBL fold metallo-hydrolase [Acidobacteriota bacterium]|nr:MBL fold metallo-hydrolase [Acidobacteriota bacterium]